MATMKAARSGWPTPQELNRQIERWLPHAAGQPHAADNLIGLLETLPLAEQAQTGLPWMHTLILPPGRGYTRGSWRAVEWLASLRDGHVLDATIRPAYDSLVDALVADDYGGHSTCNAATNDIARDHQLPHAGRPGPVPHKWPAQLLPRHISAEVP
jgi:hypothetical protein